MSGWGRREGVLVLGVFVLLSWLGVAHAQEPEPFGEDSAHYAGGLRYLGILSQALNRLDEAERLFKRAFDYRYPARDRLHCGISIPRMTAVVVCHRGCNAFKFRLAQEPRTAEEG
jgi:hypothetical protein